MEKVDGKEEREGNGLEGKKSIQKKTNQRKKLSYNYREVKVISSISNIKIKYNQILEYNILYKSLFFYRKIIVVDTQKNYF